MKTLKHFLAVICLMIMTVPSFSQEIWTIGPMLHMTLGGKNRTKTFSIETSYWNINKFIYSVDFAVEFGRGRILLYSEAQTGIGFTGVSMGPVVEFNFRENKTRLGVQGSCWLNYLIGVDYRLRFIDDQKLHFVGMYAKVPIATSGLDDEGGTTSWDDWDDWD